MSWMRRVADGLRTRSAGALLLELIVLVVGILLALGVDGWLVRRREAAVTAQSLELVRHDLAQLVEQAQEIEAYNRGVLEAVAVMWSATVRYYEELERGEEIILRNNEAFTDGLLQYLRRL